MPRPPRRRAPAPAWPPVLPTPRRPTARADPGRCRPRPRRSGGRRAVSLRRRRRRSRSPPATQMSWSGRTRAASPLSTARGARFQPRRALYRLEAEADHRGPGQALEAVPFSFVAGAAVEHAVAFRKAVGAAQVKGNPLPHAQAQTGAGRNLNDVILVVDRGVLDVAVGHHIVGPPEPGEQERL